MVGFQYQAISDSGEVREGVMEAADREAVIASLHAAGNYPLKVEPAASAERKSWGWTFGRGLSQKYVAIFTRQLATLLEAGLPLDRSLEILITTSPNANIAGVVSGVLEKIMAGKTFADALEAQKGVFSRIYVNTVRAGESSGSLNAVLERLADYLEKSRELRETVISAMIYPAILLMVAGLSVVLLLTQVVPQFSVLFEEAGAALPLPTQIVIATGDWLQNYWWMGLLVLLGLLLGFDIMLKNPTAKIRIDRVLLGLPLAGDLVRKLEVARFARTLGTLLRNGVNPLSALAIVKETMSNLVIAGSIDALSDRMKEGQGIAGPMEETGRFPKLAVQMIRVGEETGGLESMLLKIADIYDKEVTVAVKRLLTLLEPMLILLLGVLIAGIIISVLLAVLNVNELAFS